MEKKYTDEYFLDHSIFSYGVGEDKTGLHKKMSEGFKKGVFRPLGDATLELFMNGGKGTEFFARWNNVMHQASAFFSGIHFVLSLNKEQFKELSRTHQDLWLSLGFDKLESNTDDNSGKEEL